MSTGLQEPSFWDRRSIKVDDQVVGVLMARASAVSLSEITARLTFGESGAAFIVSLDGTILAGPVREYVLEQRNVLTDTAELAPIGEAIRELGVGNAGVVRYTYLDDTLITALAPMPQTGWMIGIGALESEVLSDVYDLMRYMALISLGFLAVGIIVSVIVSRRIAAPLIQQKTVVEGIAEGDFTQTVPVKTSDEVGALGRALNQTVESMRHALGLTSDTTDRVKITSEELAAAAEEVSAPLRKW